MPSCVLDGKLGIEQRLVLLVFFAKEAHGSGWTSACCRLYKDERLKNAFNGIATVRPNA
jgi:hypothetical protein